MSATDRRFDRGERPSAGRSGSRMRCRGHDRDDGTRRPPGSDDTANGNHALPDAVGPRVGRRSANLTTVGFAGVWGVLLLATHVQLPVGH